ncbi:3-phosphoshikimate 1-carboxyvinyltransferase [Eggerthella sinensis]|uniref:3-phosphoshikimate 1-carboxyvinyltransferase n=1 Tax=Eggerthella sinensis TaxID=242230 RepID=A0A3N0IXH3_9ACTN|nr:3-phosphoshikimate 1-carboxyvinyltransferase [Eggerthella sinensis]MCB7037225.1 3-phosphoshikimate 1-carboxyvinyltransferase [Eggerthella sinensis]RDB70165.1 3-phosphoshikimate 1-carboxyvinyltransferase [Eggerthella sinensis]RNM41022.1 3-phosphoshikimate 1-carboxyvinyltransferase [Eggerthella sinensis]
MSHDEANATVVNPLPAPLRGAATVPGDKSISHRAVLFAAMAEGTSRLAGVLDSEDVRSSIKAVSQLGAQVSMEKQPDGSLAGGITGWGSAGPVQPDGAIDCGNSGTTVRLLMGVLAPWNLQVELTGDESLQRRPMRRITAPLMKMGVRFEPEGRETLPLTVCGSPSLRAITYDAPMASAQLKTAVLLAGVYARGTTTLNEPSPSRNHTELMLPEFGVTTTAADRTASVTGPAQLGACEVQVPGDPSSAAFLVCAAVLKPGSSIQVENVSLNTARIGFTRTLERMGADISVRHTGAAGKEPYGIISACHTPALHGCEVPADKIATLVDEVPVLALVAAHARGVTVFREVSELRVKETDRLAAIVEGLETLGVDAWIDGNDLFVEGQPGLQVPAGATFDSKNDHRLAMTWALAGLCGSTPVEVENFDSVKISYPQFLTDIERLAR